MASKFVIVYRKKFLNGVAEFCRNVKKKQYSEWSIWQKLPTKPFTKQTSAETMVEKLNEHLDSIKQSKPGYLYEFKVQPVA